MNRSCKGQLVAGRPTSGRMSVIACSGCRRWPSAAQVPADLRQEAASDTLRHTV